jgi:hypothetical protein
LPDFQFAHGAIQWTSAEIAGSTHVVSGLAFQPKALRFYWTGIWDAADARSSSFHWRVGVGFATSPTDRRAVASLDFDNTNPSYCDNQVTDIACVKVGDAALDLTAISSGGFTLTVDTALLPSDPTTVFWEAWGGADITAALTGELSEPAAIGTQDYSATGFTATGADQVVMFAACQQTGATPSWTEENSGIGVGFASSPSAQVVAAAGALRVANPTDCGRYTRHGECVAMCTSNSTGTDARARLSAFLTDGFRLDWLTRAVTGRRVIYLAIKGGRWRAGSTTLDINTVGTRAVISELPFTPVGVSVLWNVSEEGQRSDAFFSLGSGSSGSSRRAMSAGSWHAQSVTAIDTAVEYDQIGVINYFDSLIFSIDLESLDPGGFTIINDGPNTDGGNKAFVGFLTFGPSTLSRVLRDVKVLGFFDGPG